MFHVGERVRIRETGEMGTVLSLDTGFAQVQFDDLRIQGFPVTEGLVEHADGSPAPSYPTDIVHAAMLRHAINAGAAVTALEIIRRDARLALNAEDAPIDGSAFTALNFIEKFAGDVLSQVLPA